MDDLVIWNGHQYRKGDLPADAVGALPIEEWRIMHRTVAAPVVAAAIVDDSEGIKPSKVSASHKARGVKS